VLIAKNTKGTTLQAGSKEREKVNQKKTP